MKSKLPVLIVEDSPSYQRLIKEAFSQLHFSNEIIIKDNGVEAFEYLKGADPVPFLIISDINMPKMHGLELIAKIHEPPLLVLKSIPFIFLSSSATRHEVTLAYSYGIQGYFEKPMSCHDLEEILASIFAYWSICKQPELP